MRIIIKCPSCFVEKTYNIAYAQTIQEQGRSVECGNCHTNYLISLDVSVEAYEAKTVFLLVGGWKTIAYETMELAINDAPRAIKQLSNNDKLEFDHMIIDLEGGRSVSVGAYHNMVNIGEDSYHVLKFRIEEVGLHEAN